MKEAGINIESESYQELPESLHEEPSFKEKISEILSCYEICLSMEQKGIEPSEENVDSSFVEKRRTQLEGDSGKGHLLKTKNELENEYKDLICEASVEEYNDWRLGTLEKFMAKIITQMKEEQSGQKARDPFNSERMSSVLDLFMKANAEREKRNI
jgi:hypothetical protein